MEQLGVRLQRFRLRNGWSKRVVAGKLGVSIPSIMRWEECAAEPNDYNRYKIEQLLSANRQALQPDALTMTSKRRIHQLRLFGEPFEQIPQTK